MFQFKRTWSMLHRNGEHNMSNTAGELDPLLPVGGGRGERNQSVYSTTVSQLEELSLQHQPCRYIWLKIKCLAYSNAVNVLLPMVPVGIVVGAMGLSDPWVFGINFLAIIPLAALMGFVTEEMAEHVGETIGGLLNATFGNAIELIVCIFALLKGEIRIVQASMLGSILSNMLLVLGMAFLFGGLIHKEQTFNSTIASTMSSLMAVGTVCLMIPAALIATIPKDDPSDPQKIVLQLSRWTSLIMLGLYIAYLWFQLKSHHYLFKSEEEEDDEEDTKAPANGTTQSNGTTSDIESQRMSAPARPPKKEKPQPALGLWEAAIALVVVTVLVSLCADYLVSSIEGIVQEWHISKTFIGLILIPIVGNAAEHVSAVMMAMKNKMNLALGVAVGSSMQIALLVTPFMVVLGWIIGQPMTLHFQTFETVILFVSTYLTYHTMSDGKSNYLEGAMLLGLYVIIAIGFFVYPDTVGM